MPPEPPPSITVVTAPSGTDRTTRWHPCWKPIRFRLRGAWTIGIVRIQVQRADGSWVLHVEYSDIGLHPEMPKQAWIAHDPRLILPIEPEPPGHRPGGDRDA